MVAVIINYSYDERIFIEPLISQCQLFADEIIVSYGSHYYNGDIANHEHFEECRQKFPNVTFVEYKVDTQLDVSKKKGVVNREKAYWHNLGRWTAFSNLKEKNQWIFVIDGDEIPNGNDVKEWYNEMHGYNYLQESKCFKMACHWYFKDVIHQAEQIEDSILLIHGSKISEDTIFGDLERDFLIYKSGCSLVRNVRNRKMVPMWHHFSFVRTREGLRRKIECWAHANEGVFGCINKSEFIEQIYETDTVNDVVHNYTYKTVPNFFSINFVKD